MALERKTIIYGDTIISYSRHATFYGNIVDVSSEAKDFGVCWSTSFDPDIEDNSKIISISPMPGDFNYSISGLQPATTYYVKAFFHENDVVIYSKVYSFTTIETLSFNMVSIAGGIYEMGNNMGPNEEKPEHEVTLSDFEISKYEITNQEFVFFLNEYQGDKILTGQYAGEKLVLITSNKDNSGIIKTASGWEVIRGFELKPVVNVTWYGAYEFARYYGYRLPTEAEWEYAAKGGKLTQGYRYSGSDKLIDVAWYNTNAVNLVQPVGQKVQNELGIFDMSGNVWEWCNDWYDSSYYTNSPANNPQGPATGEKKILRGGACNSTGLNLRTAVRNAMKPYEANVYSGFRIAL